MNAISKISPWTAKPLSDAAKARKFRAALDLNADRVLLGRSAILTGWALGGVGVLCLAASAAGWIALMPLKTIEYRLVSVDQSTGIISTPVSLKDAPRLFSKASDEQYLRRYIEAREQYIPELDQQNDHLAKIMSAPAEQNRIAEERKRPDSPANALGQNGHVSLALFRFHEMPAGKDGTREYLVQYLRQVWRGNTPEPAKPCSATVAFQWHPELPMTPDDRTLNTGGFQGIAYSASSDTPDNKRQ